MIVTTPLGVPVILNGAEAITIDHANVNNIAALELERPGTISEALQACKASLALLIGLDPMLPDDDWYMEFQIAMNITAFAVPVQMLQHANHVVHQTREADADV